MMNQVGSDESKSSANENFPHGVPFRGSEAAFGTPAEKIEGGILTSLQIGPQRDKARGSFFSLGWALGVPAKLFLDSSIYG